MSTVLLFLILGLGSGAVYAALSLGLVVTYRSSGVVNLASAAIALYIAYTYAYLRMGQLVDPIPGLSPTVGLGTGPLGFWPAFADLAGRRRPCSGRCSTRWSSARCARRRPRPRRSPRSGS